MAVLPVGPLPQGALDAAGAFHANIMPRALALAQAGDLVLVFAPAPYDHRAWRLAAVQDLARVAAPRRVNGIAGDDEASVARTIAYLEAAPGVTGQILAVDGKSAENR